MTYSRGHRPPEVTLWRIGTRASRSSGSLKTIGKSARSLKNDRKGRQVRRYTGAAAPRHTIQRARCPDEAINTAITQGGIHTTGGSRGPPYATQGGIYTTGGSRGPPYATQGGIYRPVGKEDRHTLPKGVFTDRWGRPQEFLRHGTTVKPIKAGGSLD
jgi:hypothetical protein